MKEKEEAGHRAQSGKHHQNAGNGYGKWQKGAQAVASRRCALRALHLAVEHSGRLEVGQQKSENRAYVSNVTRREMNAECGFQSLVQRVANARAFRISSTAPMAASSSSSFV